MKANQVTSDNLDPSVHRRHVKAQSIVGHLKIMDMILLKVVNVAFVLFQWRLKRFLKDAGPEERQDLWQNLVKSHFLVKTKLIMSYQETKHKVEIAELCDQAHKISYEEIPRF